MATEQEKLQELRKLEIALGEQFYMLYQAANFRINLARQYGLQSAEFKNYNKVMIPMVEKWWRRERHYEELGLKAGGKKGIISAGKITPSDFYISASLPKIHALVREFNSQPSTNGVGWVALVVWAIIGIASLVSMVLVSDDLTTTTEEKESLMRTTTDTCKQLNLTPAQCNAMIQNTQAQASDTTGGLMSTVKWVGGGLLVAYILKETGILKTKQAA